MKTLILNNNYATLVDPLSEKYKGNFAKIAVIDNKEITEYSVNKLYIIDLLALFDSEYCQDWLEYLSIYQPNENVGLLI